MEIEENAGYLGVESTAAAISFLLSTLVFFGLLCHVDDRVIGFGVSVDDGGGRGNRILAANGSPRRVERLGGHQVGGRDHWGGHHHVVNSAGGKTKTVVTEIVIYTTLKKQITINID